MMTLWTVAHQAPVSMGFSRQEYWTGLLFPSPGDLPGDSEGQGSLACCSLWGRKELDTTEQLNNPTTTPRAGMGLFICESPLSSCRHF